MPDPKPSSAPVTRAQLWGFGAAQEYALVSPAMHEEFLYRYQMLNSAQVQAGGLRLHEDLTRKLDMLKELPNLRRIAITPVADVASVESRARLRPPGARTRRT